MYKYRKIQCENYLGFIFSENTTMYSAAYHILKKSNYPNLIKGYFLKQNGRDKIVFDLCEYKSICKIWDMLNSKVVLSLVVDAIRFMYWVKHSSFIHLDSIMFDLDEIFVDSNYNNLKFICLPGLSEQEEADSTVYERSFVYAVSCILFYSNCMDNRSCQLLYTDCQSGYYLIDELYRDVIGGRYGQFDIDNAKGPNIYNERVVFCVLKSYDSKYSDIVVDNQTYVIGKKKEMVDFCIDEDGVSRQHCKITVKEGNLFLEDLHSTNGTMVNNVRIFPEQFIPLNKGDCLTIAGIEFEVQ